MPIKAPLEVLQADDLLIEINGEGIEPSAHRQRYAVIGEHHGKHRETAEIIGRFISGSVTAKSG